MGMQSCNYPLMGDEEGAMTRYCTRLSARADAAQVCRGKLNQHRIAILPGTMRALGRGTPQVHATLSKLPVPTSLYFPAGHAQRVTRGGQVQGQHLGSDGRTHENTKEAMPEPHRACF